MPSLSSMTSSSSRMTVSLFFPLFLRRGLATEPHFPAAHSLLLLAVGRVPSLRAKALCRFAEQDRIRRRVPRKSRPVLPPPRLPGPRCPYRHLFQDHLPRLAARLDDLQPHFCRAARTRERVVDAGRVGYVAGARRIASRRAVGLHRLSEVAQGCVASWGDPQAKESHDLFPS